MDILEYFSKAIQESWREDSDFSFSDWTLIQLANLLENILVDNPHLESYYREYADQLRLL